MASNPAVPARPTQSGEPAGQAETPGAAQLKAVLLSPGYLKLLLLAAVVGIPVSLVAFGFVSLEHQLQHWVWESSPDALGYAVAPWWWPLPALTLAGLLIAPVLIRMPGHGGHLPVQGLGGPPVVPKALPSVVLAALIALPLGAALGPEAPLMALGGGLALMAVRRPQLEANPKLGAIVSAAGSSAAISTIFGNPLVAGVMMLEAAGLGGPQLLLLVVPCLLASGIGALVFTGFGHWTGLGIGALSLPSVPKSGIPDATELLWTLPVAALIALVVVGVQALGWRTAAFARGPAAQRRAVPTVLRTILCAVAVGVAIACYALFTGRSPEEAALSGQTTLAQLAEQPASWGIGTLVLLVLFKGLAWGISLGSLRGGPIFPALLVGAAAGVACGGLPGLGIPSGFAVGLAAAGTAITGLPVTSTLLAMLLIGDSVGEATPLLIVSSVVAFVVSTKFRVRPETARQT
jgi:H+/Cl- antiporter ClcA